MSSSARDVIQHRDDPEFKNQHQTFASHVTARNEEETAMPASHRSLYLAAILLLLPALASAQATIAGTARDASGAVLPGVTVEAASPALIEKVRTVVTDGTGQYQII